MSICIPFSIYVAPYPSEFLKNHLFETPGDSSPPLYGNNSRQHLCYQRRTGSRARQALRPHIEQFRWGLQATYGNSKDSLSVRLEVEQQKTKHPQGWLYTCANLVSINPSIHVNSLRKLYNKYCILYAKYGISCFFLIWFVILLTKYSQPLIW